MDFLTDILRTIQGQYGDNYNQNLAESSKTQANDDDNLQCEKQIIQCQITNDRLLGSTSKSLRKKYYKLIRKYKKHYQKKIKNYLK